jgi:hypothetical protein
MKTYAFKVVLEKDKWPDEPDSKAVWQAYIPQGIFRASCASTIRT